MPRGYREASRANFHTNATKAGRWPGDDVMKLGCMQRIADACELMAKNHDALQTDRDMYKKWCEEWEETCSRLSNRVRAQASAATRARRERDEALQALAIALGTVPKVHINVVRKALTEAEGSGSSGLVRALSRAAKLAVRSP